MKPDLIVIGGGIIGCSAAAYAAERGASVLLLEEREIGAGASGRNSGSVQYPFDPILAALHLATL
ncbi:MAG TPA: FAD-dependent oxidoreductase, partial [Candidatus Binatia bacterium]|nr:FAD-dependent oxidoreductase [Candidatus Binatia bacterium]